MLSALKHVVVHFNTVIILVNQWNLQRKKLLMHLLRTKNRIMLGQINKWVSALKLVITSAILKKAIVETHVLICVLNSVKYHNTLKIFLRMRLLTWDIDQLYPHSNLPCKWIPKQISKNPSAQAAVWVNVKANLNSLTLILL